MKKALALIAAVALAATAGAASIDVPANGDCAMNGTNYGLEVTYDGTTSQTFVRDDTPADELVYRCQFWLDVNTWDGNDASWVIIARATWEDQFLAAFQAMVVKKTGLWRLWIRAVNNTTAVRFTNRINLQPGTPSLVQVEWYAGDTPGTLSGEVIATILDGYNTGQSVSTGLNNSNFQVDFYNMGAMQPKADQSGTMCLDEFASFRTMAP